MSEFLAGERRAKQNACTVLRFGDEGCLLLCKNLTGSRNITQLSLTYCDLGTVCGGPLGQLLIETAIAYVFTPLPRW